MWDKQKEVFLPSTPGLGMHVEVKDPEGKVGPPQAVAWGVRSPENIGCPWRAVQVGPSLPAVLQVVLSRQYGSEGRFTFTSHTPGDHQICLHSNSTRMVLFTGGRLVRMFFGYSSESLTRFQSFDLSPSSYLTLCGIVTIGETCCSSAHSQG